MQFPSLAQPPLPNQRLFYDTEFFEYRNTIHPVSYGFVRMSGECLYLLHPEWETVKALAESVPDGAWVLKNMFPEEILFAHEPLRPKTIEELRAAIESFCGPCPTLWAYIGSYDNVALRSGVFGNMIASPKTWPYTTMDLALPLKMAGLASTRDFPELPEELPNHNALCDGIWTRRVWTELYRRAIATEFGSMSQSVLDVLLHDPR